MKTTARFNARAVRNALLARGGPTPSGFVRHAYRPFDARWLYWEADTKLLDEKRADYRPHVFEGNLWLGSNKREIHDEFTHGTSIQHLGNWKLANWGIHFFPLWLREDGLGTDQTGSRRPNLSGAARHYLDTLGMGVEDLFHHALAVLHDPAYRRANAGALRMEWPRIPLPGWPDPSVVLDPSVIPAKSQPQPAPYSIPGTPIPDRNPEERGVAGHSMHPEPVEGRTSPLPQSVIPAKAGIQTSSRASSGQAATAHSLGSTAPPKRSPPPPPADASSPACSTPKHPSPASPPANSARKSPPSPCHPPSTAATCPAPTSS